MAFQAHQLLSEDKEADAFHLSLLTKAKNYSIILFATSTGHIGVAPQSIRADDIVDLFSGLRTPMILRPDGQSYPFLVQLISTASCKERRGKMMNATCKSIKLFNSNVILVYSLGNSGT